MKITVDVSEKNEGTRAPFWLILNPCEQNMSLDPGVIAHQIYGLFFSREEAEEYMKLRHYEFSKRAVVWCCSGHHGNQYCQQFKK